jgi:hypothetical protein
MNCALCPQILQPAMMQGKPDDCGFRNSDRGLISDSRQNQTLQRGIESEIRNPKSEIGGPLTARSGASQKRLDNPAGKK